jgi:hypothetical protein
MVSCMLEDNNFDTHVTNSPRDSALLACGGCLVGLAVDAQVHDVVAADGAVVDDNVPGPERYGVPLEAYMLVIISLSDAPGVLDSLTFLTSNFFFPSAASPLAPALAFLTLGAAPASIISTSAMVGWFVGVLCCAVLDGWMVCGVFAVVGGRVLWFSVPWVEEASIFWIGDSAEAVDST